MEQPISDTHRTPTRPRGFFVTSLDFELHWGVRDKRTVEQYRANLLGVRRAIPAMLDLFEQHDVHATWASVGFLFYDGREELLSELPAVLPAYRDARYSPYAELATLGRSEADDPYHFAPSLLRLIQRTPGQELATHTFSHYYCLEPGQDARAFEADIAAAMRAGERLGSKLRSIVFPRNQVNLAYLPVCERFGIRAYRGNPGWTAYEARQNGNEGLLMRAARLADQYAPLSGHKTSSPRRVSNTPLYDIPASSFLRPHSRRLAPLDPLRKSRIIRDISFAAQKSETYHLWWHPHNFGTDLAKNIEFLRSILNHVAEMRSKYGMQSVAMAELADIYETERAS